MSTAEIPDNNELLDSMMPVAPLRIICHESSHALGELVNQHLKDYRKVTNTQYRDSPIFLDYEPESFLVDFDCSRFGSGEGKATLNESIRGKDIFIIADVTNHSLTYKINGFENHMSPDDIYQDIKRIIAAIAGKAHRVTVVMPFLYESRQHKRHYRESLDCALAIEELNHMGVSNIITFDAHDPRVQNSAPLKGFDNFLPPYQFIKSLIHYEKGLVIDKDHLVVISPDEGALDRAVYFAGVLGVNTGMFYKRRDYSRIVNGKNPIIAHEFLGDEIDGKDVIIIDDMISSGGSMIDTARQLREMNAKRVFICTTFGLFTDGLSAFDEAYEKCYFDKIITTNLTYHIEELSKRPYYIEADMSKFLASIIDFSNHDMPLSIIHTPTAKMTKILEKYNNREED
ncbi:MAG: ribose-phosphate pyrophosphokinase [Lachnospiraceae bacterium]|nr:ribose-phosphate pyrophosphokinase [Lachnospiraceae bacterium]